MNIININEKNTNLTTLLKYFNLKHKIIPISDSELIHVFFKEVLDYFYKNLKDIPKLDYSDNKLSSNEKFNIIKKYFMSNSSKDLIFDKNIVKIYDLIDCMFYITKKFLGYCKFNEIFDVDLLFYILFYKYFSNELNLKLINKLKITENDYNIIEKCNNVLIKATLNYNNNKNIFSICEPEVIKYESLYKKGITLLFKMVVDFRHAGTKIN